MYLSILVDNCEIMLLSKTVFSKTNIKDQNSHSKVGSKYNLMFFLQRRKSKASTYCWRCCGNKRRRTGVSYIKFNNPV